MGECMSEEALALPRHVDEPPVMLMWTSDEVGVFFFLFIMGFMIEQTLIALVLGYFAVKMMRRFKNTRPNGYLIHILYWAGVSVSEARTLPNPYERNFRQ